MDNHLTTTIHLFEDVLGRNLRHSNKVVLPVVKDCTEYADDIGVDNLKCTVRNMAQQWAYDRLAEVPGVARENLISHV